MNAQKFTQKSLEAVQQANNLALANNNMQIEQEHLLYALLTTDDSLIAQLLKKMEKDPKAVSQAVKQEIDKMPGVTGYCAGCGYCSCQSRRNCRIHEGRICFGGASDDFFDGKCKPTSARYF